MNTIRSEILRELHDLGIDDEEERMEMIDRYLRSLKESRKWAGLTSKRLALSPEKAVIESIGVIRVAGRGKGLKVVEIGSGGGVLGMVLAIIEPGWDVTMVEASRRKSVFLAETAGGLGIENAHVVNGRAEDLRTAGEYDLVLSRAAGRLKDVAPTAMGLLRKNGRYVAVKGSSPEGEIMEAVEKVAALGGRIIGLEALKSASPGGEKSGVSVVVIEKM